EFHGSLYDYARNSVLAANSFENNARGKPRSAFNAHQGGGSMGGPIARDSAFFFAALESIFVRSSDLQIYYVPTPQLIGASSPATQAIFRKYPTPSHLSATDVLFRTIRPFDRAAPIALPAFASTTRYGPADTGVGQPQNAVIGMVR